MSLWRVSFIVRKPGFDYSFGIRDSDEIRAETMDEAVKIATKITEATGMEVERLHSVVESQELVR
tara:strand:+ start:3869 stop:4063 length:195 start_codon:yes stop_codon:yes gene_type:complete